jgi:hypothetical protein
MRRPTALHARKIGRAALVEAAIFSRGWGSSVWTDTHLTYMINIALTTDFTLAAGSAR